MLYIISPTKTMKTTTHYKPSAMPQLWEKAELLLANIKMLTVEDIMHFMHVKEALAIQTKQRFDQLSFHENGYCAIEAYDGLQFKYMQMEDLAMSELSYLQEHLRILSGFYGVLRPFDGVTPYRLEMQARIDLELGGRHFTDLYGFWGDRIYRELVREDRIVINLASREYSKAVEPYLEPDVVFLNVVFGCMETDKNGNPKIKVKGTEAKMARGEMVRYLAETGGNPGIRPFGLPVLQRALRCEESDIY